MTTCFCCDGEAKRFGRFKNRNGFVQRFRCCRCGKCFSEPQPLDHLRTDKRTVIQIVKLLTEGIGVRSAARLTGCRPKTVLAVLRTIGQKCEAFLDAKVRHLEVGALQIDELWARVGIRQSRTSPEDRERGDFYTFIALTAREKFIVSHYTGKRDYESTDAFVADLASRIVGRVQITTDGWAAYPDTIRSHLLYRLDYAMMQKIYRSESPQGESSRRYSPAPFVGVRVEIKAGAPREDRISTSFVERCNLSVRHFNKRFARLGLGWSRRLENHRLAVALFVATHNFCKVHSTLGTTPAHGVWLTDRPWKVEELIEAATSATI
jgi:IS1 family transposase/transposase-like protein